MRKIKTHLEGRHPRICMSSKYVSHPRQCIAIVLTESSCNENTPLGLLQLENYQNFVVCNRKTKCGGLVTTTRHGIKFKVNKKASLSDLQNLSVNLELQNKTQLLFSAAYSGPKMGFEQFTEELIDRKNSIWVDKTTIHFMWRL